MQANTIRSLRCKNAHICWAYALGVEHHGKQVICLNMRVVEAEMFTALGELHSRCVLFTALAELLFTVVYCNAVPRNRAAESWHADLTSFLTSWFASLSQCSRSTDKLQYENMHYLKLVWDHAFCFSPSMCTKILNRWRNNCAQPKTVKKEIVP